MRNGELILSLVLGTGQTVEVALGRLLRSEEYLSIPIQGIELTKDLVRSVELLHDVSYATREFVLNNPIALFEGVNGKEQYSLVDGNHRTWAAHKLGLLNINARFVPCAVWYQFIVVSVVPREREFGQARRSLVQFYTYTPFKV